MGGMIFLCLRKVPDPPRAIEHVALLQEHGLPASEIFIHRRYRLVAHRARQHMRVLAIKPTLAAMDLDGKNIVPVEMNVNPLRTPRSVVTVDAYAGLSLFTELVDK